jgi:phosphate transport system substrate-binding protein
MSVIKLSCLLAIYHLLFRLYGNIVRFEMSSTLRLALAILTLACGVPAGAADIAGAGSTFVTPILARWAEAYKATSGVTVTYQSIGSASGIKQIEGNGVDFGASDAPLTPDELEKFGLVQFPLVLGGVVPVVNLPGIEPGKVKLTGEVLANIYLGKITKWQNKAIADLNPDLTLPVDQTIAVIYRSDGSGTTYLWADYLAKLSAEWKDKIGVNMSLPWPTGLGGRGNEGVAALTIRTPGAIGYVEYAYAKLNNLSYVRVPNTVGEFVAPNSGTFEAAAVNADWAKAPGFHLLLTNQPGQQSWPITGATFILMHKHPQDPDTARAVLAFFDWVYHSGATTAGALEYILLPESVVKLVEQRWRQITDRDGKPIWTGSSL